MAQIGSGVGTYAWTGKTGGGLDTTQTKSDGSNPSPTGTTVLNADMINDITKMLLLYQDALGLAPAASFASVQARLDELLPTSPGGQVTVKLPTNDVTFVDATTDDIQVLVGGVTRYIRLQTTPT